jgi:hypothetical protein
MKKFEISRRLIDMIEPVVKPLGFEKQKGEEDWLFYKNTSFGYNEISLLIWSYDKIFYVGLAFSIRISEINKVCNPYSTFSQTAYETNSTIGAGINSFGYGEDGKIKVETPTELDNAINTLKDILIKNALPFFKHFTTIKSVDEEFNRENRKPHLYVHDTDRCLLGITAAALNQNPNFSYWEQYYRDKLRNASQSRKEKYEALVTQLKSLN